MTQTKSKKKRYCKERGWQALRVGTRGHWVEILDRESWDGLTEKVTFEPCKHVASRGRAFKVEGRGRGEPQRQEGPADLFQKQRRHFGWKKGMKWLAENEDKNVVDGRWHRAYRSLQGSWLYPEWEGTLGGFGQNSNCRVTEVREGRDGLGSSQGNRGMVIRNQSDARRY